MERWKEFSLSLPRIEVGWGLSLSFLPKNKKNENPWSCFVFSVPSSGLQLVEYIVLFLYFFLNFHFFFLNFVVPVQFSQPNFSTFKFLPKNAGVTERSFHAWLCYPEISFGSESTLFSPSILLKKAMSFSHTDLKFGFFACVAEENFLSNRCLNAINSRLIFVVQKKDTFLYSSSRKMDQKTKEKFSEVLRKHYCWIVYITLALVGIIVPIVMASRPCEDETTIR